MSYLKCFKSDFHEFVSRFIVLFFIIHVVVANTQFGTLFTSKTNYSNNESIEVSCQYNNEPADEINDYFNIQLHRKYKDENPTKTNHRIYYNDTRFIKNNKTLKITFEKLDLGYYDIVCSIVTKEDSPTGTGIDIKSICVGTKPEPVQNFTCINYAFDKLVCSFDAPYNPVPPVYTVEVRTGNQYLMEPSKSKRKRKNNGSVYGVGFNLKICDLNKNPNFTRLEFTRLECTTNNPELDTPYTFIVKSQNDLSEDPRIQTYNVNLLNVTVPPKVELKCKNVDISTAEFSFLLDYSANYEHDKAKSNVLLFNLTLQSNVGFHSDDQFNYSVTNAGDQFSLKLKDLPYPNYTYNVTLKSKMSLSPNDTNNKYFSEPVSKSFTTEPTVPYRPPRTNMGAFEIIRSNSITNVTIFWEALEEFEHNGPGFKYEIKVFKNNTLDSERHTGKTDSSATFEIKEKYYTDYRFEIVSRNDKGASSKNSSIFVSRHVMQRKPLIEDVWKVRNDKHANLTWYLTESIEDFANFTVFWCAPKAREDFSNCKSSINFEEISKHERSHVFQNPTCNYGISLNFPNYSSGLVWNSCSEMENKPLEDVKGFSFDTPAYKTQVGLRWQTDCKFKSIISGYHLKYCLIDNDNCVDLKNETLGNKLQNYEVRGLKPYSKYNFSIGMIRGNEAVLYTTVTVETSQAAPSPPQNLTFENVTSSTVFLKWTQPEEMNGAFKGYKVYFNNNTYKPTNYTNITLTDLDGNADYNLYVIASTIEDSDRSNVVKIKTKIGVPSQPKAMQVNSFEASWQRPERPNGEVEFYEVTMGDRTSLVFGLNCTLKNDFCNGPQENKFQVNAVNVYPSDGIVFGTGFKYGNSLFEKNLCEIDDSDLISEKYQKNFAFYKSEPLINNKYPCGPFPWWSSVQVLSIILTCIFVPLVALLSFYKVRKWNDFEVLIPKGLLDSSDTKNHSLNIPRDDEHDGDSEQTMETTENETEWSTLNGKAYSFQVQDFEKIISEKPQPQFYLANESTPVIDNFDPNMDGSGYIKIQQDSGYIKVQPNAGGYVSFPLSEPAKIKNESEYFAIETEESSIPAPLMSGYVTPGGNFYK